MEELNIDKIKPALGMLLVEIIKESDKTESGLYISNTQSGKNTKAIVISQGKEDQLLIPAKVGQTIFIKEYSGNEICIGDRKLQIIKFDDVLATIE